MTDIVGPYSVGNMNYDCAQRRACWLGCQAADLSIFNDCFPRGIHMTDIDGAVEINGQFLFVEWKTGRAGPPNGQRKALKRLTEDKRNTVVLIRGELAAENLQWLVFKAGGTARVTVNGWTDTGIAAIKSWVSAWAACAETP